jgi:GGDEF domain-containing protein
MLNDLALAHTDVATTPAVDDVTTLLPPREAVLDRLAEHLDGEADRVRTLLVLGLLRRDDGRPTPQTTLAEVTTLLARSLRGDDWLGSSGPAEFVVLIDGPVTDAETAAARLCAAVSALGIPGLSASAGIVALTPGLHAGETLRRAMVTLTAARHRGVGTLITYRDAA